MTIFYAPQGAEITLELDNNDALNNGTDAIVAIATVTQSDSVTPIAGVIVHFELLDGDSAQFTDNSSDRTNGKTGNDGTIKKSFTDITAETGEVHIYIIFEGGDKATKNKDFAFKAPLPDSVKLSLNKNQTEANGQSTIIATALVTQKTIPLEGKLIHFSLPDSKAYFIDNNASTDPKDGYSITQGYSDKNGLVSVPFVNQTWQEGEVHAWFDLGETDGVDQKIDDQKNFIFTEPPSLQIKLQPLEYLYLNNGETMTIQYDHAAADGVGKFITTASVTVAGDSGQRLPLKDVAVVFSLPVDGKTVFTLSQDQRNAGATPYTVTVTTDPAGNAQSPQFSSIYINNDTITAYIASHQDAKKQDSKAFFFTDPWQDVTDLLCQFRGNISPAVIYANGLHQAQLQIKMTLASSNDGTKLGNTNQPDIETVANRITFIDYVSRIAVGSSSLYGWKVSRTSNIYNKHFSSQSIADIGEDRVEDGIAYITYYLTCDSDQADKNVQLGLSIMPSGSENSVTNCLDGDLQEPFSIQAQNQIIYSCNDLTITPQRVARSAEQDNYATEDHDNLWRQWDYQLRFSDDTFARYKTSLFRCLLKKPSDMMRLESNVPFSMVSNMFYHYAAYFWPTNVYDPSGAPLPSSDSYPMSIGSEAKKTVQIPVNAPDTLYFTLYAVFGNGGNCYGNVARVGSYRFMTYQITLFDQYGNQGRFSITPSNIPSRFNIEKFNNWQFITDGHLDSSSSDPGHFPGKVRIISCNYVGCNLDYNSKYKTADDSWLTQIAGSHNNYNNTYTIHDKPIGAEGICLSASEIDYYNYLYVIWYPHAKFSDSVYSVQKTDDSTNLAPTYLYPVWTNNTMVMFCYNKYVYLADATDYARMRDYIQGNRAFEFTFQE